MDFVVVFADDISLSEALDSITKMECVLKDSEHLIRELKIENI
jgi:hypothetical protein